MTVPLPAGPFLYPIIDTDACVARGIDPIRLAEGCLRGGAGVLQLRMKRGADSEFLELAERLLRLTRAALAPLIINDRLDIARMAGADGAHVGQDDLPAAQARRLLGPEAIVGLSTHSPNQVDDALASSASYVAVGPVFKTATKDTGYEPRGLELVRYAAARGKPVVAIGGIDLARAPLVTAAGADGLAIISDLLTGDAEKRARDFCRALRS